MVQRALFKEVKKMTNKETITRNIGLTFGFVNHLIDNPHLIDNLPDNFRLIFVEPDFINTTKSNDEKLNQNVDKKYVRNTFEFGNM